MTDEEILKAAKIIQQQKRTAQRQRIKNTIIESTSRNVPLISSIRYPVIYADPPWQLPFVYTNRAPENYYPTMSLTEICDLPVPSISTDDAILFIWTTNSHLEQCLKVVEAWKFQYITNFVWVKDRLGLGCYVRHQHELLLIAKKGQIPTPEPSNRPSSVIHAAREQHSKKPDTFYDLIEQMYPNYPKIELFARASRPGWDRWGNHNFLGPTGPSCLGERTQ